MQVAVAGMGHGRDDHVVLALDPGDLVEHGRHRAPRYRDVLDERGPEGRHRCVHRPSDREESIALDGVVRDHGDAVVRAQDRGDGLRLRTRGRTVGLDCELRGARRRGGEGEQGVDGGEARGIHELHDRGLDPRGGHRRGPCGRRPDAGEGRRHGAGLARHQAAQLERGSDDDAERSFRPHDEGGEVEPGDPLHAAVPEVQQAPVGEDEIDTEDRIADDAVLRAEQSTGSGRDVAADGGDVATGRIGRPPESLGRQMRVEVGVEDPGFDHGEEVVRPHLEDGVHATEGEDDLSVSGIRCSGESGPGTAHDDGRARSGRDPHGLLHVVHALRVDDGQGKAHRGMTGAVGCGVMPGLLADVHARPEGVAEQRDDAHDRALMPARGVR